MCGIAGIVAPEPSETIAAALHRMMRVQEHRGPDDQGCWFGQVGRRQVALGHLRLAIIDLTESGHQPMFSPDRNYAIVYNGEVYNYLELRAELEATGVIFRTSSDTEVVLWALIKWGEEAVAKFNGMWALVWVDLHSGKLMLSRDRFGIKPLYLYRSPRGFFFASEIKALLAATGERFAVEPKVAERFIGQSLLDVDGVTFFSGIEALPAGHNLVLDLRNGAIDHARARRYWIPRLEDDTPDAPIGKRIEEVRAMFSDSVRIRLRSDVPVGVLLSGGVDSSSIAAVMQRVLTSGADLHPISAVSDYAEFDETPFINQMEQHLGCPVHKVRLSRSPSEWFHLLSDVIYSNDEPVGSFSPVAHYLLMEEAKRVGVTVILGGQGGDELLCGYLKFTGFYLEELLRHMRLGQAARALWGFLRNGTVLNQFELSEAKRYIRALRARNKNDIRGPLLLDESSRSPDVGLDRGGMVERQLADLSTFSVPALVHYEDRCSMAWAREMRLPFLDVRLVNLLLPLDPQWKLRDGWTKWIFRKAMEPWIPQEVVWRKDKQGFINPQSQWLKSELRPAIESILNGDMLTADAGLVDRSALKRRYEAYCAQEPLRGILSFKDIFNPIALEIWARRFDGSLKYAA
jgi:asparagine synthase (glutamine-hydrolysing)